MTVALFLLRCAELNIFDQLDNLTVGMVNDMYTEKANDNYDWKIVADQSDFDKF